METCCSRVSCQKPVILDASACTKVKHRACDLSWRSVYCVCVRAEYTSVHLPVIGEVIVHMLLEYELLGFMKLCRSRRFMFRGRDEGEGKDVLQRLLTFVFFCLFFLLKRLVTAKMYGIESYSWPVNSAATREVII